MSQESTLTRAGREREIEKERRAEMETEREKRREEKRRERREYIEKVSSGEHSRARRGGRGGTAQAYVPQRQSLKRKGE